MKHIILSIQGMSCQGCVNTVKNTLSTVYGVHDVVVELAAKRATILCDDEVNANSLVNHINTNTTYKASLLKEESPPHSR